MTWYSDVFVDELGREWVCFSEAKLIPEPPPASTTLMVTVRLTGAMAERQLALQPMLPFYVPPY